MKKRVLNKRKQMVIAVSNPHRLAILSILSDNLEGLNISQLKQLIEKIFGRTFDITTTIHHLELLKKAELIIMKKQQNTKGRPIIVKIKKRVLPIFLTIGKEKLYLVVEKNKK